MQTVQPLPALKDRQTAPLLSKCNALPSSELPLEDRPWSIPTSERSSNPTHSPSPNTPPPDSTAFTNNLERQCQKSTASPDPNTQDAVVPTEHLSTEEDTAPPEYAHLPPIQTHNAVWYGPDMLARKHEWQTLLSPAECDELEAAARAWLDAHPDIPSADIAIYSPDDFPLPTMRARLLDLRRELMHGRGFAIFRNLPVARLSERECITIFSGIASHLGAPRSQNAQGDLVGNIRDVGLSSADPNVRIYQTCERQGFHCDWSDVVGLLCINPAMKGGDSLLCSSSTIWNEMRRKRPDLAAALLEPVATDRRGEVAEGELPYNVVPVFTYYEGFLTALFHRAYIESAQRHADAPRLTPRQREAIEMFDELARSEEINFEMRLAPGDMQFVYNHTLLHDRSGYQDWPGDGAKRHLLRVWVALPEDRPLPEVFVSRYGSVEIGNRGGVTVTKPRPSAVAASK